MTVRADRGEAALVTPRIVWRARAIVFDFDGTLVDSNPIKWRAFDLCFEEFPEHRAVIGGYCRGNNHTPRGDKFRHVYERILGLPYTKDVDAILHRRFEAATTQAIIAAPAIAGAERFLAVARDRGATALLSATPQTVLERIVGGRGWRRYFGVIRGAPVDKIEWLNSFRRQRGLDGEAVVVFGDSEEDAVAAAEAKCAFIGVRNPALDGRGRCWIRDYRVFEDLATGR